MIPEGSMRLCSGTRKVMGQLIVVTLLFLSLQTNTNAADLRTSVIEDGDASGLSKKLDATELYGYTAAELRIIRNTIFARHGYQFKSADLNKHFSKFKWYKPDAAASKRISKGLVLTKIERKNTKLIKKLEQEQRERESSPLPGKCFVCSGHSGASRVCFCSDGLAVRRTLGIGEDSWDRLGRWRIEKSTAVIQFTKVKGEQDGKPFEKKFDKVEKIDWSIKRLGEATCKLEDAQKGTSPCRTP
jgi:YARHG domain-containing protein